MNAYREHHAICQSELKILLKKSPAHLFAEKFGGLKREETPDLWRGSYAHCKLLTPHLADSFPLYGRGKQGAEYKAEIDRAIAETPDIEILNHWIKRPGAIIEMPIFDVDPDTGIEIKGQPDVCLVDENIIVDLKTTGDASPGEFERSVLKYGYHIQAAFYIDMVKRKHCLANEPEPKFLILALEKSPPYCVASYYLNDEFIEYGRSEYKRALEIYKNCNGKFPGYGSKPKELFLPNWLKNKENFL